MPSWSIKIPFVSEAVRLERLELHERTREGGKGVFGITWHPTT